MHLLDVNLLIALAWPHHVHHAQAHGWFGKNGSNGWATCPLTQVAFVRISSNSKIIPDAVSPREAVAALRKIIAVAGHRFWHDDVAVTEAPIFSSLALVGHRQTTDAYLLALAQHRKSKLATLDKGVPELIPIVKDRSRFVTLVE